MIRTISLLGLIAATSFLAGCGSPPPRQYDDQSLAAADVFRKISKAYMQAYQSKRMPPTPDDLKPFLKDSGESVASLVSPRDKKPIVLVPFVPDAKVAEGEEPILAYESEGVDGERMMVDSRGFVRLEKDADFARIKFAGGHKPK